MGVQAAPPQTKGRQGGQGAGSGLLTRSCQHFQGEKECTTPHTYTKKSK